MITREADYAIRAMVSMAQADPAEGVTTAKLARNTEIPYPFLRRIVKKLTSAGLVVSSRGKGGGVAFARQPGSISLYDAVAAIDRETVALNMCVIDGNACNRSSFCGAHTEWTKIQKTLNERLADISLARLAEMEKRKQNTKKGRTTSLWKHS